MEWNGGGGGDWVWDWPLGKAAVLRQWLAFMQSHAKVFMCDAADLGNHTLIQPTTLERISPTTAAQQQRVNSVREDLDGVMKFTHA